MAHTLREIAPECSIFAINGVIYAERCGAEERVKLLEKSIDWAIANRLDILTYSHPGFTQKERLRANNAVQKAVQNGLITTFIHNDSEHNIWPYGCMPFQNDLGFGRQPDVNIYHFDYNTLFLPLYERYQRAMEQGKPIKSGNDLPYFSFLSMSVVLGGFVAILKGLNSALTSASCKELLRQTSYAITQQGQNWYDCNPCEHVVHLEQAVRVLLHQG